MHRACAYRGAPNDVVVFACILEAAKNTAFWQCLHKFRGIREIHGVFALISPGVSPTSDYTRLSRTSSRSLDNRIDWSTRASKPFPRLKAAGGHETHERTFRRFRVFRGRYRFTAGDRNPSPCVSAFRRRWSASAEAGKPRAFCSRPLHAGSEGSDAFRVPISWC